MKTTTSSSCSIAMSANDPAGEPSCKRQENGDATTGSDRPLKKARFAWQVKGKYHLKNDSTEVQSPAKNHDVPETPGTSSQTGSSTSDLLGSAEQNLEILGDYLLKQDFNTLDSVITDTGKSLLHPCASVIADKIDYHKYQSSTEQVSRTLGSSDNVEVLIAQLANSYNEDQCIARWQARQQAKGFVDNTINHVLDSWMTAHLPTGLEDNGFLALDVAEFINNLPGDNSIENEGILMAISAHGLQNNSSSSSEDENQESTDKNHDTQEIPEKTQEKDKLNSDTNSSHDIHMEWLYDDDRGHNSVSDSFRGTSSPTYLNCSDNDHLQNPNLEFDEENVPVNDFMSHFDFMDAAVSFAIQNKGLTSFGTDYG